MLNTGSTYKHTIQAEVLAPTDVVVAGGGTAGVVAALAAARNGARVTLVENRGSLGGMLTDGNAGITMFTKFSGRPEEHAADQELLRENPDELHIAGGIPMEMVKRLIDAKLALGNVGTVGSYVFTSPEDFKRVLFEMMAEAGVQLRLHSLLTGVIKSGDRVEGVVLESKSGCQILPATVFIDATGDGDLSVRAGAAYTVGVTEHDLCAAAATIGEMHPMGVMFRVGNVDLERLFTWLGEHREHYQKQPFARFTYEEALEYFRRGDMATIDVIRENEVPRRFQVYNLPTPGVVTLCCPSVKNFDGCKVEDLTRAEELISAMLGRWMESIRTVPGFENSYLAQVPEMGVRETRHIEGDYRMSLEDIYHQKSFDDCIGFGSHPIDTRPRPEWLNDPETAYPPRWFFQIPLRALLVKGVENLLVTGRCLSATHEAFGCIRPTVQCMITGEAAGTAAALAVKAEKKLRELAPAEVRAALLAAGVKC